MKISKYNRFIDIPEHDIYVICNLISRGVTQVEKSVFEKLKEKKSLDGIDGSLLKEFQKGYIVLNDDVDEFTLIRHRHNTKKFSYGMADLLTVIPTLDCNFSCEYCFVNRRKSKMSREVAESLLDFIEKRLEYFGTKGFSVLWFGGEPFLALNLIFDLNEKIQKICQNYGVSYTHAFQTNGTLIQAKDIEKLKKQGLEDIQVTLDGPQKIHDQRRAFAGKNPSYEIILNNVESILGMVPVSIRFNTDEKNSRAIFDEVTRLRSRGWFTRKSKCSVYIAPIVESTPTCNMEGIACMECNSYWTLYNDFQKLCLEKDVLTGYFPSFGGLCSHTTPYSYYVDPDGNLFKCDRQLGDNSKPVGNVMDGLRLFPEELKYLTYNPFSDEECIECSFLPACLGGCAANRLSTNPVTAGFACTHTQESFDNQIINFIINRLYTSKGSSKHETIKNF